jgi:hypothetical protein
MKDYRIISLYTVLLMVISALLAAGCKKSGEPEAGSVNAFKRYPYERFHLTYEYGGDLRGTEELFVSGFGKYEARYSKFDVLTPEAIQPMDNGSVTRISDNYVFDFMQKSIVHDRLGSLDSLYHLDEKDIPSLQENLETEMRKNFFRNTGTDTLSGKLTTRWQKIDGGMTLWIWNSILFRKQVTSDKGGMDMRIKTIDSLWTVDTTKFSIPAGLKNKEKPVNAPGTN